MKIDLMDWDGQRSYSFYENFRITDEAVRQFYHSVSGVSEVIGILKKHHLLNCLFQNKYRLQYGLYSGRAGDALTGGGGMVEQWSACLSGMQFSTRDHVSHLSLFTIIRFMMLITAGLFSMCK